MSANTVFVSSTNEDLVEYRAAAKDAINRAGMVPKMQEYFAAGANLPLAECLKEVKDADVLIVIVAHRYGWVPDVQAGTDRKSITWLECIAAKEAGKDVLAFLVDESFEWPDRNKESAELTRAMQAGKATPEFFQSINDNIKRLQDFKNWLNKQGIRATFTTPEDLHGKVFQSVEKWKTGAHASAEPEAPSRSHARWTVDDVRRSARKASDDYIRRMEGERVYLPHLYARRLELERHLTGFLNAKCTKTGFLIIGTSGIGKTNTLCHIVKQWRDDQDKLGPDAVLLVGGNMLPGGNFKIRDVLLDRLEISGSFPDMLSRFRDQRGRSDAQLVFIVDSVDKHPQPEELLRQLDDLIASCEDLPWVKIIVSIGEVTYNAQRNAGFILATRAYFTVKTEGSRGADLAEIPLGPMTDEELAEAYGKYVREPGMQPKSEYSSLTNDVKNTMCNPLFLKIVMEVYDGRMIPRRVLTAAVLQEYCSKKVFDNHERRFFTNQFLDYLYNEEKMAVSLASLDRLPKEMREAILDRRGCSAYYQLLDEQVLAVTDKHTTSLTPQKRTLHFTYDRLLEYLLLVRLIDQDLLPEQFEALSIKARTYLPLCGVLTTYLFSKVESREYEAAASMLQAGSPDSMTSVGHNLLLELEHIAPTTANTPIEQLRNSQVGRLVDCLLKTPNRWVFSLLLEFGERLQQSGLYRRASFIYERLAAATNESTDPQHVAELRQVLGDIKSIFGNQEESLSEYQRALKVFRECQDHIGQARVLNSMGRVYFDSGEPKLAEQCLDNALEIEKRVQLDSEAGAPLKKAAHWEEAQSLIILAEVHHRRGDIPKAIKTAEEAKGIYDELNDERRSATATDKIGEFYRRHGFSEMARSCHCQALATHQRLGDKKAIANDLCKLGLTHLVDGSWDKAYPELKKSLDTYEEIGDKFGAAYTCNCLGETLRWQAKLLDDMSMLGDARQYYERGLSLCKEMGAKRVMHMCYANIGIVHVFAEHFDEAVKSLAQAVTLQRELFDIEGEPETLAWVSAAELGLGRTAEALEASDAAVRVLNVHQFGEEDVQLVYWYRYQIMQALGRDSEKIESLRLANADVVKQREAIQDAGIRERFVQNSWLRREIVNTWNRLQA